MSKPLTVQISPQVEARLRMTAAIKRKGLGAVVDEELNESLPSRTELAALVASDSEEISDGAR